MLRSVNELTAMAFKAARGANAPLGNAEDFASAVAWLATCNPEALASIPDALILPFDPVTADGELKISNGQIVMAGPVMVDALRIGMPAVEITHLDVPELVAAYLGAFDLDGIVEQDAHFTRIVLSETAEVARPAWGALDVPDTVWQALDVLAAKTYVPSSEASRLAGAGAGLTDND